MPETDPRRPEPRDLIRAMTLLTRLPVPGDDGTRAAEAAWAWPLVGLLVAAGQVGVGLMAMVVLPAPVAAGFAVLAGLTLTGALHEDGLSDCADGFWGGITRERRLEIMKDSRIGSYGALALVITTGLRWVLLALLLPAAPLAILAAGLLARAGMVGLMASLPFARTDGLASRIGHPPVWSVWLAGVIAIAGSLLLAGSGTAILATGLAACAAALTGAFARAKIGGQTGDVLGAAQVTGELAALLACAAILV